MIILNERVRLMEEGKIGDTGRVVIIEDGDGNKRELKEPEEIHTFQAWKAQGKSVKKGEHAVTFLMIWKQVEKKVDDGEKQKKMILKRSAFFAASQVEDDRRAG